MEEVVFVVSAFEEAGKLYAQKNRPKAVGVLEPQLILHWLQCCDWNCH